MKRFVAALLLLLITPQISIAAEVPKTFNFSGSGWGHGVGMSQVGARGMALEGASAAEIVSHYYPGTTLAPLADDVTMRVNIGHQLTNYSLSLAQMAGESGTATAQLWFGDLTDIEENIPTGESITVSAGSKIAVKVGEQGPSITITSGASGATTVRPFASFTLRWSGTRFLPGARMLLSTTGNRYRYGQIHFTTVSVKGTAFLEVTNDVRLRDEYLRGIGEMPSSWPAAALQAQAIAVRSYALAKHGIYRKECDCDIYASTQDLAFTGYSKESEVGWGDKWVSAVNATYVDTSTGLTITNKGRPVTAFFFASSGGFTQDVLEVWGSALPWLVSVPDPWSLDVNLNPTYANWNRSKTQAEVAKAFGLTDVASISFDTRTKGGGVKSVTALSTSGKTITLSGEIFRSRLGLPSTWISRPLISLGDQDSVESAIAIGKFIYPSAKSAIVVAGETSTADIVTALPISISQKVPLLLTSANSVDDRLLAELKRRKISSITLVSRHSTKEIVQTFKSHKVKSTVISGSNLYALSTSIAAISNQAPILIPLSQFSDVMNQLDRLCATGRPILWSNGISISKSATKIVAERGATLLGRVNSWDPQLIDALPDGIDDLRDDQDLLAYVPEWNSVDRIIVSNQKPTIGITSGAQTVDLTQVSNYLQAHPSTSLMIAIGLTSEEVASLRQST